MRATVAPGSLRAPAKKPSVLSDVARMSGGDIREKLPRISLRSCGLRLRRGRCGRKRRSALLSGVARMSGGDIRERPTPHIAALMRATVAPGALRAPAKKRHVKRCSPDERSDIRERLTRISLRSCGLR